MRQTARVLGSIAALVLCLHSCLDIAKLEAEDADGGTDAAVDAPSDSSGGSTGVEILDTTIPVRPSGAQAPSGKGLMRWFVARRVFAGTIDPETGKSDPNAWRRIGLDVDGECTSLAISESDTSATCQRPATSSADSLVDGDDCRDNAYGEILSSGTQTLASEWEAEFHASVANGFPTMLLRLSDLDPGPDDPYVPGAVYMTVERDQTPAWDGSDSFEIQQSSLNGSKVTDPPAMAFPKGYLSGNVWVSGEPGTNVGNFPVLLIDHLIPSAVDGAVLMVALDAGHEKVSGSVMSGSITRTNVLNDWAPYFEDVTGCNPLLLDILMKQFILPSMDLGSNPPSFKTPGQECTSLSIGAVYEWVPAKAPSGAVEVGLPFDPCDGG